MHDTLTATVLSYLKGRAAARAAGMGYDRLMGLIRSGRLDPPVKDSSGDYVWTPADLERARQAGKVDRRRKRTAAPAA
jgi:hypothetical protein